MPAPKEGTTGHFEYKGGKEVFVPDTDETEEPEEDSE